MIYLQLSDEEIEYTTTFPVKNVDDILHTMEEMVRIFTDLDGEVDRYILERAEEIKIKQLN